MGSGGGFRAAGPAPVRQLTEAEKGPAIKVGLGDAEAARSRQSQIVAGTQSTRTGADRFDTARTQELKKQLQGAELSQLAREIDFARGRQRAQEEFGEGALGRIDAGRSQDIQNVIQQRRDIADRGFGAEAFQAAREQALGGLGRQQEAQQRQLQASQAAKGVGGGLAIAQQLALQNQQQQTQQGVERQLFLDEVGQRQQAISGLEQSATAAEGTERAGEQFNLEQRRREILGRITGQFAEAGLGVAERTSARSAEASAAAARAAAQSGGGGKK